KLQPFERRRVEILREFDRAVRFERIDFGQQSSREGPTIFARRGSALQSVRFDEFVVGGIFASIERADKTGYGFGDEVDHLVAAEFFNVNIESGFELAWI